MMERGEYRDASAFYNSEIAKAEGYADHQAIVDRLMAMNVRAAALAPKSSPADAAIAGMRAGLSDMMGGEQEFTEEEEEGRATLRAFKLDASRVGAGLVGGNMKDGIDLSSFDGVNAVKERIMSDPSSYKTTVMFAGSPLNVYVEGSIASALREKGVDMKGMIEKALEPYVSRGDIPGDIVIASFDRSSSLFENHKRDGLIGVNKYFFEMTASLDGAAVYALATLGFSHELYHEIYPAADETRAMLSSREMFAGYPDAVQISILTALRQIVRPRALSELAPDVMIGIVGADTAILEPLERAYPDIRFVSVERADKDTMLRKMGTAAGAPARFLVDMASEDVKANMPEIVDQARRQAFVQMYPYLAGLDKRGISRLGDMTLLDAFKVIRFGLPDESALDMDGIVNALRLASVRGVQPAAGIPDDITPVNSDKWVAANVEAMKEFNNAKESGRSGDEEAGKVLALKERMSDYIRGKSPEEAAKILAAHEGIAAAMNLETSVEDTLAAFRARGLMPDTPQAVVIDARKRTAGDMKQMIPVLVSYAKAAPLIEICVIMPPDEKLDKILPGIAMPANVSGITEVRTEMTGEGEMVDDLAGSAQKYLAAKGITVPLKAMSVALVESVENVSGVVNHVKTRGEDSASFVIAGKETASPDEFNNRMNRIIPSIAIMNLLKRVAGEKPNVITVGCEDRTMRGIKEKLSALVSLIEITKLNIGKEIAEFMESLQNLAMSV
jgi:hypothetical protein